MLYNQKDLPRVAQTAGKVTVVTVLTGVFVFVAMFIVDFGAQELSKVAAQESATTTLTVLNTPPAFTQNAFEVTESSTTTPTNSGVDVVWNAIGTDSNGADYFLLICDGNATPTADWQDIGNGDGTGEPRCATSTVQWAVSTGTISGTTAIAATTTTESFDEENDWYAWVCDDDQFNPRCNTTPVQGISATNSSPFYVNKRPVLSALANDGPVDPGSTLTFNSSSTDPDSVGGDDEIFLVICQTDNGIDPITRTCTDATDLASTSPGAITDASAAYTLAAIVRDDTYPAYGYLVDEHGHEAAANFIQADFEVNNVAPEVLGGDITLNDGDDITLTVSGGESLGYTLDFIATDANSCVTATSSDEIVDFTASVFRSGIGSSTCDGSAGSYDPNNCYPSGVATSTWNLNCTASSTSCSGPTDNSVVYNCTFPLWFVADPTDNSSNTPAILEGDEWVAAVSPIDDNAATGTYTVAQSGVELLSFTALDLITSEIPYGSLEPGEDSGTLNATTSTLNVGNTGLDQSVSGDSMCPGYVVGSPCAISPTSTIASEFQQFQSSEVTYSTSSPLGIILPNSTSSPLQVELDVPKTTSTSTPADGTTFWGIAVPSSITLAGQYSGLNTYFAVTAEATDW